MFVYSKLLAIALSLGSKPQIDSQVATYKNLSIYAITSNPDGQTADLLTLKEGLDQKSVFVFERGARPSFLRQVSPPGSSRLGKASTSSALPTPSLTLAPDAGGFMALSVVNTSGKTLMLVAGQLLLGGKQDRIVARDMLVPRGITPIDIPVFCVEQDRSEGGQYFEQGGFVSPGGGRAAAVVTRSQPAVWAAVENQLAKLGSSNETSAYRASYMNPSVVEKLSEYVAAINSRLHAQDAYGVVVAINGKVVWMDRFDSRTTFQKLWPQLLMSYALDAIADPNDNAMPPSPAIVQSFLVEPSTVTGFEGVMALSKLSRLASESGLEFVLDDWQLTPPIPVHSMKVTQR